MRESSLLMKSIATMCLHILNNKIIAFERSENDNDDRQARKIFSSVEQNDSRNFIDVNICLCL